MNFPFDIHIGALVLRSHMLLDIIALYAAFYYFFRISKTAHDPLSEDNRWKVLTAGVIGALIGSRLLAALEHPAFFFHPPSFLYYYADKTIAGGIIGAIIAIELVKKIIGEKKRSGDLLVYPLILGMMIGRVGCFLTGVSDGTAGLPSSLPWAINQGDGIPRHPTALYEILFLGILWIVLRFVQKKYPLKNGTLFRLFAISYFLFRFLVEFIKPIEHIALGLSAIQIASLAIALYYLLTLIPRNNRPWGAGQIE